MLPIPLVRFVSFHSFGFPALAGIRRFRQAAFSADFCQLFR
jgi:hypothetical protein